MQAEPKAQEQDQPAAPIEIPSPSYKRWQEIGRHALRMEPRPVLETLRDVLDDCAALIVYEHWRANGQNCARTAEALGVGRKRVRRIVNRCKQTPNTDSGGHR
jgi:DNA-binding NtrC family response regulator